MKKTIATLAIVMTLSSCATVGTKFDMAAVDRLESGVATIHDAVAALGPYSSQSVGPSGIHTYGWSYGKSNGLTGHMESAAAFIAFGKDGLLIQKSSYGTPAAN